MAAKKCVVGHLVVNHGEGNNYDDARRTTHDARRTTHDARRTTHDARRTNRVARISLMVLGLAATFSAFAQTPDVQYYNEAYEESDGDLIGEVSALTPYGMDSSALYTIEDDGYYRVVDEATNEVLMQGFVLEDGQLEQKPPSEPRPRRRTGGPGRGGKLAGLCLIGEAVAGIRCEIQCRNTGVSSISYGTCGFGSTCTCIEPPPPPQTPPPGGTYFTPPWLTINNFWQPQSCGPGRPCDDRDPR